MYLGEIDYISTGSIQQSRNVFQCTLWTP